MVWIFKAFITFILRTLCRFIVHRKKKIPAVTCGKIIGTFIIETLKKQNLNHRITARHPGGLCYAVQVKSFLLLF